MTHFHPEAGGDSYTRCDEPHLIETEEPRFALGRRISLAISRLRGESPLEYWVAHPLDAGERAFISREIEKENARFRPRHAAANIVHNPNVSVELFNEQMKSCPVCRQSWVRQSGDLMTAMSLTAFIDANGRGPADTNGGEDG